MARSLLSREAMRQKEQSAVQRARPAHPRLLSSAEGKLKKVLICFPGQLDLDAGVRAFFEDLIRRFEAAGIEVDILTQPRDPNGKAVQPLVKNGGHTIEVDWRVAFTPWGRDPFIVLNDGQWKTWLAEPIAFGREADALVADWYANAAGLPSTQTPLSFEGGNILCGDDFVLIGANSITESVSHVGTTILEPCKEGTPVDLVRMLYAECLDQTRRWFQVGSHLPVPAEASAFDAAAGLTDIRHYGNRVGGCQPIFHLDMFLTLAGRDRGTRKYRILVGDPRLAANIMGTPLDPAALADVFDDIAASLRGMGFEVTRNPMPYLSHLDVAKKERNWFYATSNNALVEVFDHLEKHPRGRVWLPVYEQMSSNVDVAPEKLHAVDEANRELWERLGFEVETIPNCLAFVEASGSIHCLIKELDRVPAHSQSNRIGWRQHVADPRFADDFNPEPPPKPQRHHQNGAGQSPSRRRGPHKDRPRRARKKSRPPPRTDDQPPPVREGNGEKNLHA
jgi:hypothetical protein